MTRPGEPRTNKKQKLMEDALLPRSAAMKMVLEDSAIRWSLVPDIYKSDKDFVADFIRQAKSLPSKNLFERNMLQEVRTSREVTLAFLSRNDFAELYTDRQIYCPHNLCNDKEVVLKYCEKIPRALQYVDPDLCDDDDVVMAAVSRGGFEIQYASVRLQSDETIIRKACQQDGRSLEVCTPSATLHRLLANREFLLMAFRSGGGSAMRKVTDEELLKDADVWLEAVTNGLLIRYVPETISSPSFWEAVMRMKSSLYHDLRREFRENPNVARSALFADDLSTPLVEHLFKELPDIFDGNRDVALAVVRMGSFAKKYLQSHRAYFQDAEIMLLAVKNNPSLYFDIDEPLSLSIPIIKAALTAHDAHRVLSRLGSEWLQNQEEVCVEAIKKAASLVEAANCIPDEVWQSSRALAMAWLNRGCRVLHIFEDRIQNDREMALAVAQYVPLDYPKIAEEFRQDPSFIREAVRLNGRNIEHVNEPSLEIVVAATGTYPRAAANHPGLADHVDEKLKLNAMYQRDFLRGVCSPSSTLYQLNVDSETSTAHKKLVAEFLGVPIGETLTLYRKCQTSLQNNSTTAQPPRPTEPLHLPIDFQRLRVTLRGGNPNEGNPPDNMNRLVNMLFDDGMPFHMLRGEQRRRALMQERQDAMLQQQLEIPNMMREMRRAMQEERRPQNLRNDIMNQLARAVNNPVIDRADDNDIDVDDDLQEMLEDAMM